MDIGARDVVAGFQLVWRDGVTEETRGTGARELPVVRRRWQDRRQASPLTVLASMVRTYVNGDRGASASKLGMQWLALFSESARQDFGSASHSLPASKFASLSTTHRGLLLQAWQSFVCGPSGVLDRALPASRAGARQGELLGVPFTLEWFLAHLMPLLTPTRSEELNCAALVSEARGVSAVSIASSTLLSWLHLLRGGQVDARKAPFVLTSGDCLQALRGSLSACDATVTEELLRTLLEAFQLAAKHSVSSSVGAGSGLVGGGSSLGAGSVDDDVSTLTLCREALLELLSDSRANGTPLPFLDNIDAREVVGVLGACVVAGVMTPAEVLPLLQDLMSSVNSRKAHFRANWVGAILSFFRVCTEDMEPAAAAHNDFLLAACGVSLADGCEPAWRLWRRELLTQLTALDGTQPNAVAPLMRSLVDCISSVGTPPEVVRVVERVLKEEPKAANPRVLLSAMFNFAAERLGSPHAAPEAAPPPSPPKLSRRASDLTKEEAYTSGRSSVFTKCLVSLFLGFMRQDEVQFADCFLTQGSRLDVFEAVTSNMLRCELFPGDFKEMVRGLSRIGHLWAVGNSRFGAFSQATNVAEQQLRRLLDGLFTELDAGQQDLFGSSERLQSLVELLAVLPLSSGLGRLLRSCLEAHVGVVVHLLGSSQFQVPAIALLPELLPHLKLSAADRARLSALYTTGRSAAGTAGAGSFSEELSHDAAVRSMMHSILEISGGDDVELRPSVVEERRKDIVRRCLELSDRAAKCSEDKRVSELAAEDEAVAAIQRAGSKSTSHAGAGEGESKAANFGRDPELETLSAVSLMRHRSLVLGARTFDYSPGKAKTY
jgi:hypothetical protein